MGRRSRTGAPRRMCPTPRGWNPRTHWCARAAGWRVLAEIHSGRESVHRGRIDARSCRNRSRVRASSPWFRCRQPGTIKCTCNPQPLPRSFAQPWILEECQEAVQKLDSHSPANQARNPPSPPAPTAPASLPRRGYYRCQKGSWQRPAWRVVRLPWPCSVRSAPDTPAGSPRPRGRHAAKLRQLLRERDSRQQSTCTVTSRSVQTQRQVRRRPYVGWRCLRKWNCDNAPLTALRTCGFGSKRCRRMASSDFSSPIEPRA